MKKQKLPKNYGHITVAALSKEPREIPILSFIQSHFKDNRVISIMEVENNSYVISVENPESTGRNSKETLWLSEESLTGFILSVFFLYAAKGKDFDKTLKEAIEKTGISYSYSDNLKNPFIKKA
jgi:hypothetical protein